MIFCDEKFSRTGKSITYFIVVSCPKSTGMEILIFHGLEGGCGMEMLIFHWFFEAFWCAGGMDGDVDF